MTRKVSAMGRPRISTGMMGWIPLPGAWVRLMARKAMMKPTMRLPVSPMKMRAG